MEQSNGQRRSDSDLSLLLRNVPGVVAKIDLEGIFQHVSGATRDLYGREPEELVGTASGSSSRNSARRTSRREPRW